MVEKMVEMVQSYLVPPGEHIQAWLDDCGMPVMEFCKRMEISRPTYYRILNGTQPINADTARRLEFVTGASAAFWSKLESDYRQAELAQSAEIQAEKQKSWIKRQPIADLISSGFLPADFRKRSLGEKMSSLCAFYNVSSVDAYQEIHTPYAFAARTVKGVESNSAALTAWLQMSARVALKDIASLPAYSAMSFKKALDFIRRSSVRVDSGDITFKDYLLFAKSELARVGVQVIYLKKVKDVKNLNGVAFWLKDHPVIVLTLHSCAMDRIVFSLYHEAAHILDGRQDLIYVTDKENSDIEIAADEMAAELLIPKCHDETIKHSAGSIPLLTELAKEIGVSLALVVGRYQKLCDSYVAVRHYRMPSIKWDQIGSWNLVAHPTSD